MYSVGVVAKKGEHKPGDKLVYCEIDSLLPERPEFEFLRASSFKPAQVDAEGETILPAGFRIKTVKLRGQISHGICFPLSILPSGAPADEGTDVTDLLGVRQWEPPLPIGMGGKLKGGFPGFLPKTDETRVHVLEAALQRHRGKTFYVTEKLDGTSFTAFVRHWESASAAETSGWTKPTSRTSLRASRRPRSLKRSCAPHAIVTASTLRFRRK